MGGGVDGTGGGVLGDGICGGGLGLGGGLGERNRELAGHSTLSSSWSAPSKLLGMK